MFQRVVLDGSPSNWGHMKSGVSQDFILGSLSFGIF